MRQLLFAALLLLAACAPPAATLSPIAAPHTFDARPSFEAKAAQHVHYLSTRYKHGHAEAIAYIYNYSALARRVEHEYGIPAQIVLAVGLLESGKGGSNIAVNSRNHFGIKKGDGWHGATFVCANGKQWRAYPNAEASYLDFGKFITLRLPTFIAAPSVEALAQSGYAGGGRKARLYAQLLNNVITRYELAELFTN